MDSQIRVVCKAGGILLFSGAYLHATVPNTSSRTRFSIDFRTVHLGDVVNRRGAENIDSECTGTTLRDFLRASDSTRLSDEIAERYDTQPPVDGELIFSPS
jgi:ectoine hydroxylase-related dioxygenase (phytanoyl-CoA dioxygenase family)